MADHGRGAHAAGINAIFSLGCGCTLDGCHDSHPGRHFAEYGPGGILWCATHGYTPLVDVVSLAPLEPLPSPES